MLRRKLLFEDKLILQVVLREVKTLLWQPLGHPVYITGCVLYVASELLVLNLPHLNGNNLLCIDCIMITFNFRDNSVKTYAESESNATFQYGGQLYNFLQEAIIKVI